jgi:hypothetical protein
MKREPTHPQRNRERVQRIILEIRVPIQQQFLREVGKMRTKKRARRAISAARRARDLCAEAEKVLRGKCDYDRGRAEYKSEIRSSGKTGPIVDPYIRWSKTLNNYIKQCGYFCW